MLDQCRRSQVRSGPDDPEDLQYPEVPRAKLALQTLVEKMGLATTDKPPEPWLLTEQDERQAIEFEIERRKKHLAWKMADLGYKEEAILARIATVDWASEFDHKEILTQVNSNKNHAVWQYQERDRQREEKLRRQQELQARYTAEFFYRMMQWACQEQYRHKLDMHDWQRKLITVICMFLSRDPRFETDLGYTFAKGLKIRGHPGLGKTFLFKLVAANEFQPIKIVSMVKLSEFAATQGMQQVPVPENGILYLDDVGTEEHSVVYYGTKINVYKQFIEKYHLDGLPFNKLIISTNCGNTEIENKYGLRVRSRHKEMFNNIDVIAPDGVDLREA